MLARVPGVHVWQVVSNRYQLTRGSNCQHCADIACAGHQVDDVPGRGEGGVGQEGGDQEEGEPPLPPRRAPARPTLPGVLGQAGSSKHHTRNLQVYICVEYSLWICRIFPGARQTGWWS